MWMNLSNVKGLFRLFLLISVIVESLNNYLLRRFYLFQMNILSDFVDTKKRNNFKMFQVLWIASNKTSHKRTVWTEGDKFVTKFPFPLMLFTLVHAVFLRTKDCFNTTISLRPFCFKFKKLKSKSQWYLAINLKEIFKERVVLVNK